MLIKTALQSKKNVQATFSNFCEGRGETKNLPLSKRFQLKRISSPFIPNLEAAGHYHLVHWWGVWDIIFTDLPRFRRKPRCFCYVLVQIYIFLTVLGFVCPSGFVFPVSCSCPLLPMFLFFLDPLCVFCRKVHED